MKRFSKIFFFLLRNGIAKASLKERLAVVKCWVYLDCIRLGPRLVCFSAVIPLIISSVTKAGLKEMQNVTLLHRVLHIIGKWV